MDLILNPGKGEVFRDWGLWVLFVHFEEGFVVFFPLPFLLANPWVQFHSASRCSVVVIDTKVIKR